MSVLRRARARVRIAVRESGGAREAGVDAIRRTGYSLQRLGGGIRRVWQRVLPYITAVLSIPIVIAAQLIALGSRVGAWIARQVDALSVALRPELALAGIAIGACLALGASQFVAYSGVAVDAPGYGENITRVAPTPITDARDIGEAHAYLLLPLAVVAVVMTLMTLQGRWRFGRLVALCGLVAVFVTLLVDLPQGIDAGRPGLAYGGAEARLLEGFWAQLSAASLLLLSGILLGGFVRRADEARDVRRHSRRDRMQRRAGRLRSSLETGRSRWRTS